MGIGCSILAILLVLSMPYTLRASTDAFQEHLPVTSTYHPLPPKPWYNNIEPQWGGHFKVMGEVSLPDDESFFQPVGTGPYYDGHINLRLKNKTFYAKWGYFETHYEAIVSGGDTRRKMKAIEELYPDLFENSLMFTRPLNDDHRLMDLTKTIKEDNNYIFYHRLDRFSLTLQPQWGTVRIGRQALTWGNGFLFNPMDLFNPFAPTDIVRDYKVGDDMATAQFDANKIGEFQLLYVPRRDPESHNVTWEQSSIAAKFHFALGTTEFDIMTARHYQDEVIGLGSTGYLKEAAWRLDATYTFLDDDSSRDGFLSLVANIDYSWVWWSKNFYGLIEFYFNDLGNNRYAEAYTDPDIAKRLARGEVFTLGRTYLSGEIQLELHPLFNIYLTLINNMADPSGIIQPRAIWDMTRNVQLTLGANINYGGTGTEYGGFKTSQTDFLNKSPDNAFLWLTYFF